MPRGPIRPQSALYQIKYVRIYIYIYIYVADSQIVYTEMVAERRVCLGVWGVLKGMRTPCACVLSLTPLASTAACRRPGKGGCAQSGFQGYAFGYALGMLWVGALASIQLYILWVRGIHPSTDPEAYPLIIPRSGPRKHSMLSWCSVGYVVFHVTPYDVSIDRVSCFSSRTQHLSTFAFLVEAGLGNLPYLYLSLSLYAHIYIYIYIFYMYSCICMYV